MSAQITSFATPLKNAALPRWQRKALGEQQKSPTGDRFIPNRNCMDMSVSHFHLTNSLENAEVMDMISPTKLKYQQDLKAHLFEGTEQSKILAFKHKAPAPREGYQNSLKVLYTQNQEMKSYKTVRNISQNAVRILDAPELLDDYYLNLLDWSSDNLLAVGLGRSVYLWNPDSGSVSELLQLAENDAVCSVNWNKEGGYVAVGTNNGEVQLWDCEKEKKLRTLRSQTSRVGSIGWNEHILSTGSRNGSLHNSDVRISDHLVWSVDNAHTQEICGLKWNHDGTVLATGGNDNVVQLWEKRKSAPKATLNHVAAVKALAFCPWQSNLLATGGGSADRHIKFWNVSDGSCLNSVDTNSQVTSLIWSPDQKELVSTHGFPNHQVTLWKYPTMTKITELTGHTSRILNSTISPDGQHVATAGSDETIRIWKCFEPSAAKSKKFTNDSQLNPSKFIR